MIDNLYHDISEFLENNHLQGSVKTPINYGIYYNNILEGVMTFSKSRFDKKSKEHAYELVRYCSNKNIIGGASKIFKNFVKDYSPNQVISFADRRWSDGDLYYKLGFTLEHITGPGYYYIDNNNSSRRYNRQRFMKHKLIKNAPELKDLTEKEIMKSKNFYRIWDCGQLKFKWYKQ